MNGSDCRTLKSARRFPQLDSHPPLKSETLCQPGVEDRPTGPALVMAHPKTSMDSAPLTIWASSKWSERFRSELVYVKSGSGRKRWFMLNLVQVGTGSCEIRFRSELVYVKSGSGRNWFMSNPVQAPFWFWVGLVGRTPTAGW